MEQSIKLPKQLNHGAPDYPSELIDQSGKSIGNINVYSNHPEVKQTIIKRYNNYPGVLTALIVMTIISVVSLSALLYF